MWTYSSPPRPRFLLRGGWELGYSPVSLEPHWDCECSLFHCCAVVYKCSNKGYNLEAAVFTLIIKIQMSILFSSTLFSLKINVKYISCIPWPGTMEPMGKVPEVETAGKPVCDFQGIQSEQATLVSYWSVDVPIVFDRFVSLSLNRWTTDLHSSYDDNRNTAFDNFLGSFQLPGVVWCGAISVDMILLKSASFLLPLTNQEPLCV